MGPALGVAWDPAHNGKMNIHAGWGIYYDNMRTLQLAGEITWPQGQQIIIQKPSFPDPLRRQIAQRVSVDRAAEHHGHGE